MKLIKNLFRGTNLDFEPNHYFESNPEKERKAVHMAQSPLEGRYEQIARKACEIVLAIYNSPLPSHQEIVNLDNSVPEGKEKFGELRKIGKQLGAEGGHWLMVLVAYRAVALSQGSVRGVRYFELFWQHICGWQY